MSLSKHQLCASMKKKCLNLDEKIEILDYAAKHTELGCRKLAWHFSVGKTVISNILKQGKTLRKDFEFFKGTYKKRHHGKYHILNEFLHNWYGKCTRSNIYPDGALLQEEAVKIKERLDKEEINDFTASNGWLESWKKTYGVREKRLWEKLMTFLRQLPRLGSSDYQNCVNDMNYKIYRIK